MINKLIRKFGLSLLWLAASVAAGYWASSAYSALRSALALFGY